MRYYQILICAVSVTIFPSCASPEMIQQRKEAMLRKMSPDTKITLFKRLQETKYDGLSIPYTLSPSQAFIISQTVLRWLDQGFDKSFERYALMTMSTSDSITHSVMGIITIQYRSSYYHTAVGIWIDSVGTNSVDIIFHALNGNTSEYRCYLYFGEAAAMVFRGIKLPETKPDFPMYTHRDLWRQELLR
jgi:hypothetical protein